MDLGSFVSFLKIYIVGKIHAHIYLDHGRNIFSNVIQVSTKKNSHPIRTIIFGRAFSIKIQFRRIEISKFSTVKGGREKKNNRNTDNLIFSVSKFEIKPLSRKRKRTYFHSNFHFSFVSL